MVEEIRKLIEEISKTLEKISKDAERARLGSEEALYWAREAERKADVARAEVGIAVKELSKRLEELEKSLKEFITAVPPAIPVAVTPVAPELPFEEAYTPPRDFVAYELTDWEYDEAKKRGITVEEFREKFKPEIEAKKAELEAMAKIPAVRRFPAIEIGLMAHPVISAFIPDPKFFEVAPKHRWKAYGQFYHWPWDSAERIIAKLIDLKYVSEADLITTYGIPKEYIELAKSELRRAREEFPEAMKLHERLFEDTARAVFKRSPRPTH